MQIIIFINYCKLYFCDFPFIKSIDPWHNKKMNKLNTELEFHQEQMVEKKEVFDPSLLISMLKKLMADKGIRSETELARQVNLPQTTIHRILSGETSDPRASTLSIIASF